MAGTGEGASAPTEDNTRLDREHNTASGKIRQRAAAAAAARAAAAVVPAPPLGDVNIEVPIPPDQQQNPIISFLNYVFKGRPAQPFYAQVVVTIAGIRKRRGIYSIPFI